MARNFNGTSQYLDVSTPVITDYPCTLVGRFKTSDTTSANTILSVGNGTNNSRFQLVARGDITGDPIDIVTISDSGSAYRSTTSTGYSASTWHHAAAVCTSSSDRAVFLDGGGKGTDGTSVTVAGFQNTTIAGRYSGGTVGSLALGAIAECAAWNVNLTDSEIAALANGFSPLLVRPQNLVAYWPLFARSTNEEDWTGGVSLTNVNGASRAAHPPRLIYPVRSWTPVVIQGGAGATVSVGLASELSTAQAISRQKQKAVGLSAETDTALATSPAKVTAVGLSTETDTAFSILRSKIKTAGLSNETDSAFSLIVSNAVNVGLSAETDSAFAISRLKQKPVGLSTETDAALSVNRSKIKIAGLGIETDVAFTISRSKLKALGLSSEVDQALAISSSGSLAVGLASELDVALVIGRLKQQALGIPTETDTSQPVGKIKTQQAGLSVESDTALDVTSSSGRVVGLATETDLAQSISRIKQRLIGLAPETDVALSITIAGVTVVINTNAKETLKLLAENPTLTLSAENATLTLS